MFAHTHGNIGQMSAPQRSTPRLPHPAPAASAAQTAPPTHGGSGDKPQRVRRPRPARAMPAGGRTRKMRNGRGPRPDPHPVEVAGLLHELSARLLAADGVRQALDRLATFGAQALPEVVRCSVALIGEGGPPVLATSGPRAQSLDDLQYSSGDGPALEAARTRAVVTTQDLAADSRWPELREGARDEGIRSVVSVPFDIQRIAVGSVTLYAESALDPERLLTALALVNQAEILLSELQRRESRHEGAIVDRAAGVIIAQRGCGIQEAYDVLRDTSQRLGLPREEVAERLIAAAARNAEA